jgi:KDO2-lipid IV(A) lauroyltransferase
MLYIEAWNDPKMPTTTRVTIKHRLEAATALALGALFRALPQRGCAIVASILGAVAATLDRRHRRIMVRQMRLAFGREKSQRELWRLSRACYRHEVLCFMELARIPKADKDYIRRHVEMSDAEKGRALKATGQGVLIITGHIGSWELLAQAALHWGYPVTALARPVKNPLLDAELTRLRTFWGNKVQAKFNSIRSVRDTLKKGDWACFLYDQNGGPSDAFIPFFGVPASTWRSASFLHWKYGTPIIVATLSRDNWLGSRFTIHVKRILEPREDDTRESAEQWVLGEINDAFEEAIRAHPEQWLWQHRRWKTRPPGEDSRLVGGVPEFPVVD